MLLSSSFFLNEVWLVRTEGVRIGLCFTVGRRAFLLVVDFGGYENARFEVFHGFEVISEDLES